MDLPIFDLLVFLIYMLAIVGFGISFSFRKRTSLDFTTGGGRLPTWAIGMSIFATFVSSISFLALPGNAYLSNWNGFVFSLSIPLAAWIAVKFFVPLYRKLNSESAYFYLEQRFGLWARVYASVCYLLTQLARMGTILYLLALPMNALFGWSIPMIIIITGISVIGYSMMGGIEAVIWTDAIQGIVLILGAITCLGIIFWEIPGGPTEVFRIAAEGDKFSLGSFQLDFTSATFWMILVYGLFINLQNFGIDQNYVQRYISAKNEKEAIKSTWLGSLLYVPVSLIFFFIGTALFAFYQAQPDLLPATISGLENSDKVFPYFIVSQLPTGITGLLIASIFAAGMSSVSTSVNSSATVILSDHYKKYIHPNPSEKTSLFVLKAASVLTGLLSIFVGLAFNGVESALDAWWALASIFSGGILGLFLLGFIVKSTQSNQAAIAVLAGVLVIFWMSLGSFFLTGDLDIYQNPLHSNMTIVLGTLTIFILGFLLTLSGKKKKPSL
ncbi:sodium:solute symporter [Algoriphagus machipongonensis]|uniref:Sodium-dependent multivitamin transporter n=1 Tax=Algoriphagus machipongonensis TaxID=388413 RepID=A3HWI1_9BACT|nr:sodium:solute symporter [Algoriphagus machipongonensis]EAZ80954.1 sodium-dependent multivitamin transporter [Algoriphagus machipongonensis]